MVTAKKPQRKAKKTKSIATQKSMRAHGARAKQGEESGSASSEPKQSLLKSIQKIFDTRIRPFVQMHGGDVELIELTPEKVLKVRTLGACVGCGLSALTYQTGVQQMLFDEFPEDDIQLLLIQD